MRGCARNRKERLDKVREGGYLVWWNCTRQEPKPEKELINWMGGNVGLRFPEREKEARRRGQRRWGERERKWNEGRIVCGQWANY